MAENDNKIVWNHAIETCAALVEMAGDKAAHDLEKNQSDNKPALVNLARGIAEVYAAAIRQLRV